MRKCEYCWADEAVDNSSYCAKCKMVLGMNDAEAPAAAADKDATLIWDDCPQCAYKHLTAAYAAATSGCTQLEAAAVDVYAARAIIAISEVLSGYPGNRALAAGCLAMAEAHDYAGGRWREARLALTGGDMDKARELLVPYPDPSAFVGAHLAEALRELPALADRIKQDTCFCGDNFLAGGVPDFLDMLRKNIKWVYDTYELEAK